MGKEVRNFTDEIGIRFTGEELRPIYVSRYQLCVEAILQTIKKGMAGIWNETTLSGTPLFRLTGEPVEQTLFGLEWFNRTGLEAQLHYSLGTISSLVVKFKDSDGVQQQGTLALNLEISEWLLNIIAFCRKKEPDDLPEFGTILDYKRDRSMVSAQGSVVSTLNASIFDVPALDLTLAMQKAPSEAIRNLLNPWDQ